MVLDMKKRWMQDAFWIAAATALSRVLGLVRETVIADQFGAGAIYDAYLVAFFIPHFLRRLLAEGALSNAFIPLYAERLSGSRQAADEFASTVLCASLLAFPALIVVGVLLAPYVVPFLADGFDPQQQALAVQLAQVTFPFIGLMGLSAVVAGVLNSHGRFFIPALAPVLFNVGAIACVLAFGAWGGMSLAVGALVGGAGQLLIQLPLLRGRLRFHWRLSWRDPGLRQLLALLAPATLGFAVLQVNVMVDNKLASHLAEGAISALQYAIRLFQLPLGVFALAISSAILPRMAGQGAQALLPPLRQGILACSLVLIPATVGLWALGGPAIRLLFEHGAFSGQDTVRTLNALQFYVLGMAPYGLSAVLNRAFYACKDGKSPVILSGVGVAANVFLALLLVGPMGVGGLALSTSLAGWVQLALTWGALGRRLGVSLSSGIARHLWKSALAAAAMGLLVWLAIAALSRLTDDRLALVVLPASLGVLVYLAGFWEDLRRLRQS